MPARRKLSEEGSIMMLPRNRMVSVILRTFVMLFLVMATASMAQETAAPTSCLAPDGKLTARLEVRLSQGGSVGFTGDFWVVEADGTWHLGKVIPIDDLASPTASGLLSAEQLAVLGAELDRLGLLSLPALGSPRANPRSLMISFGSFYQAVDLHQSFTTPEEQSVLDRYQGIHAAVKAALTK